MKSPVTLAIAARVFQSEFRVSAKKHLRFARRSRKMQFLAFGALNELSAQTIEELSSQAAAARDVEDFPREQIKSCLLRLYRLRQQNRSVIPDFNRLPF